MCKTAFTSSCEHVLNSSRNTQLINSFDSEAVHCTWKSVSGYLFTARSRYTNTSRRVHLDAGHEPKTDYLVIRLLGVGPESPHSVLKIK